MKILAIWEREDDVTTKPVISVKELKKAKVSGRRPDKLIVHERDMQIVGLGTLKKALTRTGIIIQVGSENKCLYDGRRKTLR